MRLLIARCEVLYEGRLGAHLPEAVRLIMLKADGSVAIHCDSKAYKPLNWMTPPCTVTESEDLLVVTNQKGERLEIHVKERLDDLSVELGDDPGLNKDGVEADLQVLLAERLDMIEPGLTLIRREYPTDIGPIDILCRDSTDQTVAIEIKRIGEIAGVEQLARYLERLENNPMLKPIRGMFVATQIKPQAKTLAASRNIGCVEVDLEELRDTDGKLLSLF